MSRRPGGRRRRRRTGLVLTALLGVVFAALIALVVIYPGKLKSWANSTQEAAGSSIST